MNKIINLKTKDLKLNLKESSILTIVIENKDVDIDYSFNDGEYKLLLFNNTDSNLNIHEKGSLNNSSVEINYIELNNNELNHSCEIEVNKGSNLNINTVYLGINNKNIDFNLINKEKDSTTNITNNAVAMDDADFVLKVNGKILKGSKSSKAHQKSRCLTLGKPKKAKVFPILEIDENDVEASHSLSSGTIDDDVLFYMNSRGLNRNDAISLLLKSYLMPKEEFYSIYPDGNLINDMVNLKVANICSR